MKVELHLHTSRYSPCSKATPEELMERLIATGYGAVYITEHSVVWSTGELADLQRRFPQIRVFSGVEVMAEPSQAPGGQHLVVLGTNDPAYIALSGRPREILARARQEGCLTIMAHPFRWPESSLLLDEGIIPDCLEYRTGNHDEAGALQALQAAEKLRVPLVNTGDVHGLDFVNRFWIETDSTVADAKDIRPIILAGAYRNCTKA